VLIIQLHPSFGEPRVRERELRIDADGSLERETGLVVCAVAQGVAAEIVPTFGLGLRRVRSVPVRIETPDSAGYDEQTDKPGGERQTRAREQFGRARDGGSEVRMLSRQS